MAASVSSALPPVRSISLPTRLNPASLRIEGELNKLKNWRVSATKPEPLEAESIKLGLLGLANLYRCVDGLIQSPASGHALKDSTIMDKALDESIVLLDTCSLGRDLASAMNEQIRVLQLGLRRKGAETILQSHLGAYLSFRKKAMKDVSKSIRALKQTSSSSSSSSSVDSVKDQNYLVQVMNEVREITIGVLQSFVLFLSSPALKSKLGGFSMISKLVPRFKGKKEVNEIESLDLALYGIHQQVRIKEFMFEATAVQRKLEELSPCMEGLEDGLDGLYKCLIRYRVSLLNVLNH